MPLGGDNDPRNQGILTASYIPGSTCKGLCPSEHYSLSLQYAPEVFTWPATSGLLLDSQLVETKPETWTCWEGRDLWQLRERRLLGYRYFYRSSGVSSSGLFSAFLA